MKKVEVTLVGTNHYLAQCTECDWEAALITNGKEKDVRNATYRHVRKTGHRVVIEKGVTTWYELAQSNIART